MRGPPLIFGMLYVVGCGGRAPLRPQSVSLGGHTAARVGKEEIAAELVGQVADAQRISTRDAMALLSEDALASLGARAAGLDRDPAVMRAIDMLLARQVIDRTRAEVLASGLPTSEEVEALTRQHWRDFDLPESMRVIHVVVLRPTKHDPALDQRAREIASDLAMREASASSAEDFEARAQKEPHEGVEIRVERLEPFVADGRIVTQAGNYDATFAAAAASLPTVGATTGVVESPFGWHVIRLLERLPGKHVPLDERREAFAEETYSGRANRRLAELVRRLRQDTPVEIANGVDSLMAEAMAGLETPPDDAK
jgi:hypothetical protein